MPRLTLGMTGVSDQKDEDAGDECDNSSNKAEMESETPHQAVKDSDNSPAKQSDVFCKGHGAMICGHSERSRRAATQPT